MREVFTKDVSPSDVEHDDGGQALILQLENSDSCMFVRIQSWDENKQHAKFSKLIGRRVKVTIEIE